MKKHNILIASLFFSSFAFAQVGINTETPQATLDVVGKPTDVTKLDGVIPPRITGDQLRAKTYTATQTGALVYVSLADTAPAGQTIEVTSVGYYYFDGTKWQILKNADTDTLPTGFERRPDMTATDFNWRLIGAPNANYGTAGKFGLDATWNPIDFSEMFFLGAFSYNDFLAGAGFTLSDLGAKGQNSFTAGTINSATGTASTALGAGNLASGAGSFVTGVGSQATGIFSMSMGRGNLSSGDSSFASGQFSEATNQGAIAMGNTSKATGTNAVAIGQENNALGGGTLALGNSNDATAESSVAIGQENSSTGQAAVALGTSNQATGNNSMAIGRQNTASGQDAVAIGSTFNNATGLGTMSLGTSNTTAESAYSTAMGIFNTLETSPQATSFADVTKRLFVIGNGSSATNRRDALTILRDGKTGFNTSSPTERIDNNGITRLRTLPLNGTTNAINTTSAGGASTTQNQTFTATRTVVADANGVLGSVAGLPSDTNIYNANGSLTNNRTLSHNGFPLTFSGTNQSTNFDALGGINQRGTGGNKRASIILTADDNNADGVSSNLQLFQDPENSSQITSGGDANKLNIGTTGNTQPAPLTFMTSSGSNALGAERMRITATGTVAINTSSPTSVARFHVVKAASDLTPAIIAGCEIYADNAEAITAGLPVGGLYRKADGTLMVRY